MAVKDYVDKFLKIEQGIAVQEAAVLLDKHTTGSALILDNGMPVGVVTERDFLRKVVAKGLDPTKLKVEEIMGSPLITISQDAKVKDASLLMAEKKIRRLAVTNDSGEIIGKITAHKISKALGFQQIKKAFSDRTHNHYVGNVR